MPGCGLINEAAGTWGSGGGRSSLVRGWAHRHCDPVLNPTPIINPPSALITHNFTTPPPGRFCKTGGPGKPEAQKNFFQASGFGVTSKSGFEITPNPEARKKFFRASGFVGQNH